MKTQEIECETVLTYIPMYSEKTELMVGNVQRDIENLLVTAVVVEMKRYRQFYMPIHAVTYVVDSLCLSYCTALPLGCHWKKRSQIIRRILMILRELRNFQLSSRLALRMCNDQINL